MLNDDLTPTHPDLFFSRKDPADPRLGDWARAPAGDPEVVILGYPDDDGIKLNGGRVGAHLAPVEIRKWLYRMTPHPRRPLRSFLDLGDLKVSGELEGRHERARGLVRDQLKSHHRILSLGGGNDYAYADGQGFLDVYGTQDPLIVNIDAHLDVRDLSRGASSGTPFFRLLKNNPPFSFVELGAQTQCNATAHWNYVLEKRGMILSLEEQLDSGLSWLEFTVRQLGDVLLRPRPTFLALDIDAFAWPYAVGSSASWPLGLEPKEFWPVLQLLLKRLDVRAFGIYEVSPPLDTNAGTAKLAAQLAHGFLHHV